MGSASRPNGAHVNSRRGHRLVPKDAHVLILYATTIFGSATLLFLVQPMFARMALPLLGGAPAVWNTALVFYQAGLLAGYVYAHGATAWLGLRRHAALHLILLLLPLGMLPIGIPRGWTPPSQDNPTPWLLALLMVSVGLPFFVVATSSPVLQAWFSGTGHGRAADPYSLYAASNLGSMLALLSYPTLLEPTLRLDDQSRLWAVGYGLLVLLIGGCAIALWRSPAAPPPGGSDADPSDSGVTAGRRARWVLLSFVPSSLMLSVTTYLSTDIAAIPLLWVIPLAIYLLSFILVFARRRVVSHRLMVEALPIVMLPLVIVLAARTNEPIAIVIPTHLVTFFVAAMVCHGELATDRPATRHLTEFYLWMAAGGVLGGAFTALIAPLIFSTVVEYPLMLVLACLLGSRPDEAWQGRRQRALDLALPLALGVLAVGLITALQAGVAGSGRASIGPAFGLLVLLCFTFSRRPLRFGLGVGVLLVTSTLYLGEEGRVLHTERSFFGIHRVTLDPSARYHVLLHGTTLHGMQSLDPARRLRPPTYFHATGPLGQVFAAFGGAAAKQSVAVVGLGAGSVACHGERGQRWTFYEIDPTVERIARDPRFFTFLRDCPPDVTVALGDARFSLGTARDGQYGLIILDAYSSDAPPVHLITREAVHLYLAKLAPDGILVFNTSNRHLELEPVLGNLARAAGLASLAQDDAVVREAERLEGKLPSQWVVMAREPAHFGGLQADARWKSTRHQPDVAAWTDNFSSLLSAFRWR